MEEEGSLLNLSPAVLALNLESGKNGICLTLYMFICIKKKKSGQNKQIITAKLTNHNLKK